MRILYLAQALYPDLVLHLVWSPSKVKRKEPGYLWNPAVQLFSILKQNFIKIELV